VWQPLTKWNEVKHREARSTAVFPGATCFTGEEKPLSWRFRGITIDEPKIN
jgi:hypothetical protein